jgi:hypothetical protein
MVTVPERTVAIDRQGQTWIMAMLALVRALRTDELLVAITIILWSDAMLEQQFGEKRHC